MVFCQRRSGGRLLGLCCVVAALLTGCGNTSPSATSKSTVGASGTPTSSASSACKTNTPFTEAVFQSELYLPDFVAKQEGFDAAHCIDMHFVTPSSGSAAAQLLLAGQVQGWFTDPLIILTAASKGQDIKVAGLVVPECSYYLLVSNKEQWPPASAPFDQKMQALKGKTIGVSGIGAGTDHALLAGLASAGLSASDVHRIGIGQQQAAIGQLEAGRIDAFVSFSLAGNQEIEQQTGAKLYVNYMSSSVPASVRNIPGLAAAVQGTFATQQPQVVANWLAANQEAMAWIQKNPDKAAAVLNANVFKGAQLSLAKQIVPQLLSGPFSSVPPGYKFAPSEFTIAVNTLQELGIVNKSTTMTYANTVISSAQQIG